MAFALVTSTQKNWSGNSGAGGTTDAIDTTGTDLIVVAISSNLTTTVISDSKGNTYTALTSYANGNARIRVFYCLNPTVGSGHTFTCTSGAYPNMMVTAWSGAKSSGVFLSESGNSAASGTTIQPGNLSPAESDCLVINAIAHIASTSSISAGTIAQSRAYVPATSIGGGIAYLIQTAAAATNPTWTINTATNIAAGQAIFLSADSVAEPLSATAALTVRAATTATVVASPAGGVPAYGYQWYRSTTTGFTPGAGNIVSGATSATLADTGLTEGTTYYYVCRVTDTAAGSEDTNEVAAYPVYASTSSLIAWSPYNWHDATTYRVTNCSGAYIKAKFQGTAFSLLVDTSPNGGAVPNLFYSLNNGAWTRIVMTAGQTQVDVVSGLSSDIYTLQIVTCMPVTTRWTSPVSVLRVTGVSLSAAGVLLTPTVYADNAIIYADSNGETYQMITTGTDLADSDPTQGFPLLLGLALKCEIGAVPFGSQGYTATGIGGVPALPDAWDLQFAGQTRLVAGVFSPAPKWVLSTHGQNDTDGATVETLAVAILAEWRAAAPLAQICLLATNAEKHQSNFQAAIATFADANAKYATLNGLSLRTSPAYANAGVHLNTRGHAVYAAVLAANINAAFATGGETNTAERQLLREIVESIYAVIG